MEDRQKKLLALIIEQYIKTALPIGSKLVANKSGFDLSSATIRNEMSQLEIDGYITHPYTSAGRIPTQKGYQFYVENFLGNITLPQREMSLLTKQLKNFKTLDLELIKETAKGVAALADNMVFASFDKNDFYYTGLSNLFSQPEFIQQELVYNLSCVIDHLDGALSQMFDKVDKDIDILIGQSNPFGADCSALVASYNHNRKKGLIGVLGPMRMNYKLNFGLIKYAQNFINNF